MSFIDKVLGVLRGMSSTTPAPAADDPLHWGPMQGPDPREVAWADSVRRERARQAQESAAYEEQMRAAYGYGLAPEAGPPAARAMPGAAEMYGHFPDRRRR